MDHIIREAIETELHPNNMIGFYISKSWKPLICSLKKPPEHDARSTRLQGYKAMKVITCLPFLAP
jgi:hypothetical protein